MSMLDLCVEHYSPLSQTPCPQGVSLEIIIGGLTIIQMSFLKMVGFFSAPWPLVLLLLVICLRPYLIPQSTLAHNLGLLVGVKLGGHVQVLS